MLCFFNADRFSQVLDDAQVVGDFDQAAKSSSCTRISTAELPRRGSSDSGGSEIKTLRRCSD